jgi:hypothetical protein
MFRRNDNGLKVINKNFIISYAIHKNQASQVANALYEIDISPPAGNRMLIEFTDLNTTG